MEDLGKFIVVKGFKKLPKVQLIAQSGHTGAEVQDRFLIQQKASVFWSKFYRLVQLSKDLLASILTSLKIYFTSYFTGVEVIKN